MAQSCKAAMVARVGLGHLLDNFEDSWRLSSLSPRFRRVLVDGWMWRPTTAEAIYRQTPRSKGVVDRARNRLGRPVWADRPRPVSLPDDSWPIVDLLPSACGPLTSSFYDLDRAPCRASFSIFCSGPWSFVPSCCGPWVIWSHVDL
jgi:hypothetical protein